jgi:hypothetical protein
VKTFYICYSWNKNDDDKFLMAISVAIDQQKAVNNFRERIKEKIKDGEIINYHIWWTEELLSDKEEVIMV